MDVLICTASGRSRPNPKPGFALIPDATIVSLFDFGMCNSGKSLSDRLANIDPKASSTSGNEASESVEDEFGMDASEAELGIEACEDKDGREGNDSKGGEGGRDCVVPL